MQTFPRDGGLQISCDLGGEIGEPVFVYGTNCKLGMKRRAQFSRQDEIKLDIQPLGDCRTDNDATSRNSNHKRILKLSRFELLSNSIAGFSAIAEHNTLPWMM